MKNPYLRRIFSGLPLLLFLFVLACSTPPRQPRNVQSSIPFIQEINKDPLPTVGEMYYLRHNIWLHRETHITTNYSNGSLLPINTPVRLTYLTEENMRVAVPSLHTEFIVENVTDYSKKTMGEIARNMLRKTPTDLSRLPEDTAHAIRTGQLKPGMSKSEVLMTRGFPPAHKTSTLELDRWIYWKARLPKQYVTFKDGKLVEEPGK